MAADEVFCLRLQEFDNNIKNSWKDIQSQKDFCDITLACDDKQIETHKFIISSSSPVFRNILKGNSNQHPFIYLRGVKYKDLSNLLNFMYQGEVNIPQEELNSFLAVAEDLKIKGLSEDETRNLDEEKYQSPQKDIFNDQNYKPSPKTKFVQKMDDNQFNKSCLTDDKNKIKKKNVNKIVSNQGKQNTYQTPEIVKNQNNVNYAVSTTKNNLNSSGLYSCDICGKQFGTKLAVKFHTESIHEGIRYSCDQCDHKATHKANLKKHVQSVHEKISYPCKECDYKATQTCSLNRHIKKYHN